VVIVGLQELGKRLDPLLGALVGRRHPRSSVPSLRWSVRA
jgi:hypothetical protein